jgi:hypothetical protein
VSMGDLSLDIGDLGTAVVSVDFVADSVGTATFGDVDVAVGDESSAVVRLAVTADDAADMTVGNITLEAEGSVDLVVTHLGDANDTLTIGDVSVAVSGMDASDEVRIDVTANGDVVMGDITVSGEGTFVLDGLAHTATSDSNVSFLSISAGGEITLGDVDFSGYENDVTLDLSWVDHGAAHIASGLGNDVVLGTAGANVIDAGAGVDAIDITQGGSDTVAFGVGDSGTTIATMDVVTGFDSGTAGAGDKLSFGLAAGNAGNFVTEAADFTSISEFIANAADALNSTVRYFAQDDGTNTYVAVSYGTGEADLVIVLAGVSDATTLQFQNIVA